MSLLHAKNCPNSSLLQKGLMSTKANANSYVIPKRVPLAEITLPTLRITIAICELEV